MTSPIRVPASGPQPASVLVVGEAPGADDEWKLAPFMGGSGQELTRMLHEAGLIRTDMRLTNVCQYRPDRNDLTTLLETTKAKASKKGLTQFRCGKFHDQIIAEGIQALREEIAATRPSLIVALGETALWALTGESGVTNWRGSLLDLHPDMVAEGHPQPQVLPTYNPAAIMRMWDWRSIAVRDLQRAAAYLEHPEKYQYPLYQFAIRPTISGTVTTLRALLNDLEKGELRLACDIETIARNIACVGLAWSRLDAICIPFMDKGGAPYWNEDEEVFVYGLLKEVLTHPNAYIVGQNFNYDKQHFAKHWGYPPRLRFDTMLAQHTLYPGLPKALDFISSMYCHYHRYWKDELKEYHKMPDDVHQFWTYNCLAGDTKILLSTGEYKKLQDVQVGDTLYAFEETGSDARYARRMRLAIVTNKWQSYKPVFRYSFSDGTYLDATEDHKIISSSGKHSRSEFIWKEFRDLCVGDLVVSCGTPWSVGTEYDDAWFAGILDGEGTVGFANTDGKCYPRIGFSQKSGRVLTRALAVLARHNFSVRISEKSGVTYVDINGGLAEQLRLLGTFVTSRLLHNFREASAKQGLSGFAGLSRPTLLCVTPLGEMPVYDISTTQGTFIANGVIVHNCKDCVITWESSVALEGLLDHANLREQFDFQMTMAQHVFNTMLLGVRIDQRRRSDVAAELMIAISDREALINQVVGFPLNVGSPKQMKEFFYDELGFDPIIHRKTKKPTLDDDALTKLGKKNPILAPLVELIAEKRSLGVFLSTFCLMPLDSDGRMRTSYNVAGTETFRFNSGENAFGNGGNLQNIPKGEEE